jgi:hypothetical protein
VKYLAVACLAFLITGAAQATYKKEYEGHSEALRAWFRLAKPTLEFAQEHGGGEAGRMLSWGCCEHADRVHVKFIANRESDDWSFQCNDETVRYCEQHNLKSGDWVSIPRNVVHKEPIRVPWGYDDDDPKVKDEFEQLRAEGVLFIANLGGKEKMLCFWPPESGQ